MLDTVGGPTQAESILKVLEKLCAIEEISVREKVTHITYKSNPHIGYRKH